MQQIIFPMILILEENYRLSHHFPKFKFLDFDTVVHYAWFICFFGVPFRPLELIQDFSD